MNRIISKMNVIRPGTHVHFVSSDDDGSDGVYGQVSEVLIKGSEAVVSYKVVWWRNDNTRNEEWVESWEVKPVPEDSPRSKSPAGFHYIDLGLKPDSEEVQS